MDMGCREVAGNVYVGVLKRKWEDIEMAFRLNCSRILKLVLCAALVLAACGAQRSFAQAVGATLTGTVTDPSGAAIANAQVSILDKATGVT